MWVKFCSPPQADEKSIEKLGRMLKFAIRKLRVEFAPLVAPLMQAIAHYYPTTQYSCLLYLTGVLVETLGHMPEMSQPLGMLFVAVSHPALTSLNSHQAYVFEC